MKNKNYKDSNEKATRWARIVTIGDTTTEIRVEKIENGYLVSKYISNMGKNGVWKYDEKKYFSETNPLASEYYTKESEAKEALRKIFDEF